MIGLQIPKVIFKTREGDSSASPNECSIGGKWVDKSTDEYKTDNHDTSENKKMEKNYE